ncbi:MAG: cellulose biosynthesis cyclic di-GMP-binding regulatory protein BcsB [Bdellovibrionales bacterium]|nr:cellulose biosynthesis cyclic di-GMP-binding regulatory protein BcsB [Ramlibacter sp.]
MNSSQHTPQALLPAVRRFLLAAVAAALPLVALAQTAAPAAPAATPAEAFKRMNADNWIPRSITFADLGFTGPVVLGYPDSLREIYLPVPPGVQLANATLQLDASYVRADGGRTTMILTTDGYPVSSRPITAEKGDASIMLPIDGQPRPSGFVRFNIDWRTAVARDNTCADSRTPGNLLRIEPTSRFTYRYDGYGIRDLSTAWSALPSKPTILIAGSKLSSQAYDSAWRVGVALERAGKQARIRTLPAVGDTVDMTGYTVPAGMRGIPAYASLAEGGQHKIKDAAEVGALIAMGQVGPLQADIVIADASSAAAMAGPLEALRTQMQTASPDAVAPYAEWRTRALDPAGKAINPGEVRLVSVFGRPTIVIAPDAGAKAAGLFSRIWQQAAASTAMVVQAADEPKTDANSVSLKYLGAKPATFDVLAHADWNATFDIGAVAADGKGPGTLVIDVAAAPSAAHTPPIVSVLLNEVLLGAMELKANGKRERITAPVPAYALAARNVIRVSFVRQLASDRCRETPEPYPVSVLASSHMLLTKIEPNGDFSGLMARFSSGGNVYVPASYLNDAQNTLPRVIRLAATTGVSPSLAKFNAVADGTQPKVAGPFLAIDLPPSDVKKSEVKIDGGRLYVAGTGDKPLLDLTGVNNVGILEVTNAGSDMGATYRTLGANAPDFDRPIQLSDGNIAILGATGLRTEVNTRDPSGQGLLRQSRGTFWERTYWWLLPLVVVAFFVALLVFASRVRRRKNGEL